MHFQRSVPSSLPPLLSLLPSRLRHHQIQSKDAKFSPPTIFYRREIDFPPPSFPSLSQRSAVCTHARWPPSSPRDEEGSSHRMAWLAGWLATLCERPHSLLDGSNRGRITAGGPSPIAAATATAALFSFIGGSLRLMWAAVAAADAYNRVTPYSRCGGGGGGKEGRVTCRRWLGTRRRWRRRWWRAGL